jgi:hypothetical protein
VLRYDGVRPEDSMGYFDALTSSAFKTADDGRKLFFPWGTLGRGYVLGSDEAYGRLRGQIRIYTIAALGLIVVPAALRSYVVSALMTAAPLGFYAIWMACLLRGLDVSDERLSLKESMTSQALGHSTTVLWLLEIISLAFVGLGAFIVVFDPGDWPTASASILFFGLCAAVFAFMLIVRRNRLAR